jgi:hypothetical protein
MSADSVPVRTLIALLKSFPAPNPLWLARLSAGDERTVAKALAELEHAGLTACKDGRWDLTARGRKASEGHAPDLRPTLMRGRVRASRGLMRSAP